jgi:hypothetical protein
MLAKQNMGTMRRAGRANIVISRKRDTWPQRTWHRILNAIERLQAKAPAEHENLQSGHPAAPA